MRLLTIVQARELWHGENVIFSTYSAIVSPLGFASDNNHPETKKLKEKYSRLLDQINEAYSKFNSFKVIMEMLMKGNYIEANTQF